MVTSRRARVVGLCVMGMLLIQFAWLLAVPPFFGIDKIDHTYRASSIWQGDLRPLGEFADPDEGRGDLVAVRSDVAGAAHGASCSSPTTARPTALRSVPPRTPTRVSEQRGALQPGLLRDRGRGGGAVLRLRLCLRAACRGRAAVHGAVRGRDLVPVDIRERTRRPVALFLLEPRR